MVAVEIDRMSMLALWDLRNRLQVAQRQLQTVGPTATVRMLAFIVDEYDEVWEERAPFLTGTLASATRSQVVFDTGRVFIDPATVNPIMGGRPVDYGPQVHERRPWVEQLFYSETPRIVKDAQETLWDAMDGIFRQ